MSKLQMLLMSFGLFLVFGITNGAASALAQSNPRFIPLGSGAIGALYVPNSGPRAARRVFGDSSQQQLRDAHVDDRIVKSWLYGSRHERPVRE